MAEFGMGHGSASHGNLHSYREPTVEWYSQNSSAAYGAYTNYAGPSQYSFTPQAGAGPSFEDEPPLLEELGIDLGGIFKKTRSILLHRLNNKTIEELDMGGALVFLLLLGGLHLLMGKLHFGVILGWSVVLSALLWFIVNQLAGLDASEGKGLDLYSCCCVVGYCQVPITLLSAAVLLAPKGLALNVMGVLCTLWSALTASKIIKFTVYTALAVGGALVYYDRVASEATKFHLLSSAGPLLRLLDPETTHILGIEAAKLGLFPKENRPDHPVLHTSVWGRQLNNPIGSRITSLTFSLPPPLAGLAAGFDKHGEIVEPMLGLGFGFVEIGSVTPKPQPGNSKPRVFRIPDLQATINRYGFNSLGADAVADNLLMFHKKAREEPHIKSGLLGVNLGKNKSSKDAGTDYSLGLNKLGELGDYCVINISSPNTPGLRALQSRKALEELVTQVKGTRDRMRWGPAGPPPLLIKIAPDLTDQDKQDIASVALKHQVDGLIVSNTTITRPGAVGDYPEASEAGGLSGPPLMALSTEVLADMYRLTGRGKITLIGCGGVSSGEDAYAKIRAGASLVQLYTALAYQGPVVVPRIKAELAALLQRDGFSSVADAVGVDHEPGGLYARPEDEKQATRRWWMW
ncbi:hypothetical protein QJQ45_012051 [Haematococcus lacustris]|nr:hypothetical protein QJQ45_012051 [Haematococcus lacustris]